mmetsp:Transcript_129300/g.374420  ORF Transcript_129300/g.374420 Transcript_129300/m.374420 type:complete len:224 (+) Transcript_129300:678-1349(+)
MRLSSNCNPTTRSSTLDAKSSTTRSRKKASWRRASYHERALVAQSSSCVCKMKIMPDRRYTTKSFLIPLPPKMPFASSARTSRCKMMLPGMMGAPASNINRTFWSMSMYPRPMPKFRHRAIAPGKRCHSASSLSAQRRNPLVTCSKLETRSSARFNALRNLVPCCAGKEKIRADLMANKVATTSSSGEPAYTSADCGHRNPKPRTKCLVRLKPPSFLCWNEKK